MNRREAIAALMALPASATLTRAEVKADDVIVVESTQFLNDDEMQTIHRQIQIAFPGRRVVVLDHGLTLKIARDVGGKEKA